MLRVTLRALAGRVRARWCVGTWLRVPWHLRRGSLRGRGVGVRYSQSGNSRWLGSCSGTMVLEIFPCNLFSDFPYFVSGLWFLEVLPGQVFNAVERFILIHLDITDAIVGTEPLVVHINGRARGGISYLPHSFCCHFRVVCEFREGHF